MSRIVNRKLSKWQLVQTHLHGSDVRGGAVVIVGGVPSIGDAVDRNDIVDISKYIHYNYQTHQLPKVFQWLFSLTLLNYLLIQSNTETDQIPMRVEG